MRRLLLSSFVLSSLIAVAPLSVSAQIFEVRQVSATSAGLPANAPSGDTVNGVCAISSDGNRVVYTSFATNLVDVSGIAPQVLYTDLGGSVPVTTLASQGLSGPSELGSGVSTSGEENIAITRDSRYVFFPTNSPSFGVSSFNIFRADTLLPPSDPNRLLLVSSLGGTPADMDSSSPSSSDNADRIAFSTFSDLSGGFDSNGVLDAYVRVVSTGQTILVSGQVDDNTGNLGRQTQINGAGTIVAFTSPSGGFYRFGDSSQFIDTKPNSFDDVLVKTFDPTTSGFFIIRPGFDLVGTTTGYADGANDTPALSQDGLTVAFRSDATNLIDGDTNGVSDVYVAKLSFTSNGGFSTQSVQRVSVNAAGQQLDGPSGVNGISISDDGNLVAFTSQASNIVAGVTTTHPQVYVKDLTTGRVVLVSTSVAGAPGNAASGRPRLSGAGDFVTFTSFSNNLVSPAIEAALDTEDVFRVRFSAPITLTPGVRADPPPPAAVQVTDNDATITFAQFIAGQKPRKPRKPKGRVTLEARRKSGGRKKITYQATVRNMTTNKQRKVTSKKNVLTLRDLTPGSYSVTYSTTLKQGRKTLVRTPQSAPTLFTIP